MIRIIKELESKNTMKIEDISTDGIVEESYDSDLSDLYSLRNSRFEDEHDAIENIENLGYIVTDFENNIITVKVGTGRDIEIPLVEIGSKYKLDLSKIVREDISTDGIVEELEPKNTMKIEDIKKHSYTSSTMHGRLDKKLQSDLDNAIFKEIPEDNDGVTYYLGNRILTYKGKPKALSELQIMVWCYPADVINKSSIIESDIKDVLAKHSIPIIEFHNRSKIGIPPRRIVSNGFIDHFYNHDKCALLNFEIYVDADINVYRESGKKSKEEETCIICGNNPCTCESNRRRFKKEAYDGNYTNTVKNPSIPEYLGRISEALRSEQVAVTEYDNILQAPSLPGEVKKIIEEIQNDEKDHMALLASLVKKYVFKKFPGNTEEAENDIVSESNGSLSKAKRLNRSVADAAISKIKKISNDKKEAVSAATVALVMEIISIAITAITNIYDRMKKDDPDSEKVRDILHTLDDISNDGSYLANKYTD